GPCGGAEAPDRMPVPGECGSPYRRKRFYLEKQEPEASEERSGGFHRHRRPQRKGEGTPDRKMRRLAGKAAGRGGKETPSDRQSGSRACGPGALKERRFLILPY